MTQNRLTIACIAVPLAASILLAVAVSQMADLLGKRRDIEKRLQLQNELFNRVVEQDRKFIEDAQKPGDPNGKTFWFDGRTGWNSDPNNVKALLEKHSYDIKSLERRVMQLERIVIPTSTTAEIKFPGPPGTQSQKKDTIIPAGD